MLDIHTHILPDIDDGSKDVKQSISMLRREARHGVKRVVFTPHFYANRESPEQFLKRRDASAKALEQVVIGNSKLPERILGAEVAYFSGMSRVEEIETLCIGNTRAMLIEMPFCKWNQSMLDELVFFEECRGIRPILAHVERYMRYQPMGMIGRLCESNLWLQVNASFFLNWQTSWLAMRMLKQRKIHFVGSDCHNMKERAPNMNLMFDQIDKKLGQHATAYLERMEMRLLEGERNER